MLFYSLYLDAQVGGLVTSLTHRGNPLNFTLSPVADETDLYAAEAGEWRLMFNRECQFTEYLGNQDKNGYYFGISHKVTVDRVKEARTRRWRGLDIFFTQLLFQDLYDLGQKLGRLKTIKEKQQFKQTYVDGPAAFQTLTGNDAASHVIVVKCFSPSGGSRIFKFSVGYTLCPS